MTRRRSALGRAAVFLCAFAFGSGCDESPETSRAIGILSGLDKAGSGVVVEFDLSRGLTEQMASFSLFSGPGAPSLPEFIQALERAKVDRRTRGFFVRLGEADVDFAKAEELGRVFSALDPAQPVVCHSHGYSNASLLFAARACDRIWLSPAGEVGTVGIAGQMVYLRRLLDRYHVKADFLHMGRYKSAAETLTEDGPSDAARESLLSVLQSIRQTWVDGITAARPHQQVGHAIEHGPWSPEAALERGLIDAVGYLSEARDDAKQRAQVEKIESSIALAERRDAAGEISQLIRYLSGSSNSRSPGEHIVILPTSGAISMTAGGPFDGGDGIAAEPLSKTLRRLREDDSVKAVVLRIDSPGGSALASDLIWHELMLLREKKPLIASLAGTAASGGYYMACAAHRIVAERSTVLGSIGVVGGKIMIGDALNEFGVSSATFPASTESGAGARAAYLSPLSPWDDATREAVRAQMASIYELFLNRVSKGRDLPVDHIRGIAEGRIWSGTQGLDHKLIDEFGGLTEAIALAKTRANLEPDTEVRIESGPETLLDLLSLNPDADDATIRAALVRLRATPPTWVDGLAEPIRPYAASLAPLLGKERVLAAVPFALDLK